MNTQRTVSLCILLIPLAFIAGRYIGEESAAPAAKDPQGAPKIRAYFSPEGRVTDAIERVLARATKSIDVQAYSFTSRPLARALIDAQRRGVAVRAIFDPNQTTERNSRLNDLADGGVRTWIDSEHALAHNKIMLVDGATIITGSFNFTNQAERGNAENLLIIRDDPDLAAVYETHFKEHLAHSQPFRAGSSSEEYRDEGRRSNNRPPRPAHRLLDEVAPREDQEADE